MELHEKFSDPSTEEGDKYDVEEKRDLITHALKFLSTFNFSQTLEFINFSNSPNSQVLSNRPVC